MSANGSPTSVIGRDGPASALTSPTGTASGRRTAGSPAQETVS
ncbi:hypothetical protein [Streptomyces tremellae]